MNSSDDPATAIGGPDLAECNICGSAEFKPGPGGRLFRGRLPVCVSCGSLERHRVFRSILAPLIANGATSEMTALQFSRDPSIDASWFSSLTHSIYGHENSLDIQNLDLEDGAFDIVICNHVIEHVADDTAAFREVNRITTDSGFAFVSVPNPAERQQTSDWGEPDWTQHGHYRVYGSDIVERLPEMIPNAWITMVKGTDPVTGREDLGFIVSHRRGWHDQPIKLGMRAKSVNRPD